MGANTNSFYSKWIESALERLECSTHSGALHEA